MIGGYAQDDIERVRSASDILEVIGEYLPLKRAGKNYWAPCPFHKEKTPSFSVSPTRQIFKCFGCGKGGNVFSFVMGMEHVGFPESIEILARRAGLTIRRTGGPSAAVTDSKEKLYEINLWAARAYRTYLLDETRGAQARKYLEGRGFGAQEQDKFRLGYAPDNWEFLTGLSAGKYTPALMEKAGLIMPRQGGDGYYDRLRKRVIFPIFDAQNRVVGFGGRILGEGEPKYLNSPETSLFDKSRCLYGLNWAKASIAQRRQVMVVEGYTDCLSLMRHGVEWVVATLGTALTEEHVRTLKRHADTAILVYDGDEAGIRAAERGLEVFLAREMDVKVVLLPGGLDPADFLEEKGEKAFLELVDSAQEVFDLKMKLIAERQDLSTASGKATAVDEILRVVAQAGSEVRQEILLSQNPVLKRIAGQLGIGEGSLRDRLARMGQRSAPAQKIASAQSLSARVKAEREVLGAVLNNTALWPEAHARLKPADLSEESLRKLAEKIEETSAGKETFELADVLNRLESEEAIQLGVDLSEEVSGRGDARALLEAGLGMIERDNERQEGRRLQSEMARARKSGDETEELDLLRKYQEHVKKRGR